MFATIYYARLHVADVEWLLKLDGSKQEVANSCPKFARCLITQLHHNLHTVHAISHLLLFPTRIRELNVYSSTIRTLHILNPKPRLRILNLKGTSVHSMHL